jgi:hypothetical protein
MTLLEKERKLQHKVNVRHLFYLVRGAHQETRLQSIVQEGFKCDKSPLEDENILCKRERTDFYFLFGKREGVGVFITKIKI